MAKHQVASREAVPFDDAWVAANAFSPEGVDRTQILGMLRLTPSQRLEALETALGGIAELRSGLPAPRR